MTSNSPLRALLLDFDGLICDTERAAWRSWQEVYADVGLSFPDYLWARMLGRSDGEQLAAEDLAARTGRPVSEETLAARRRRKQELASAEPLRPGVEGLLVAAREHAVATAVVSSSSREWIESHLRRLEVRGYFREIVGRDDAGAPKPAPDSYLTALARLELPAAAALAMEDSLTGLRAARAAGLRCVAVPSEVGKPIMPADADLVLNSLRAATVPVLAGLVVGAL